MRDFFVKPWPLQQPPEAKLLISMASVRGQKFSLYVIPIVSFHMGYSLLECIKILQTFIPSRLELMKTHHCEVKCRVSFLGYVYHSAGLSCKAYIKYIFYAGSEWGAYSFISFFLLSLSAFISCYNISPLKSLFHRSLHK